MGVKCEKKSSSVTIEHWQNKFNKAILILLKSGIKSDELIEKIKMIENEKNNTTQ